MEVGEHVCLSGNELFEFRTRQCPLYAKGVCSNSSRCNMSHSETWPRRNPLQFAYDYKLCPNIQFFRTDNKMQLHGKCNYGRRCKFSHSKEEQLYHPDLYKTRMCLNFPNCKGYYCPFAHSQSELRQQGTPIVRRGLDRPKNTETPMAPPSMVTTHSPMVVTHSSMMDTLPILATHDHSHKPIILDTLPTPLDTITLPMMGHYEEFINEQLKLLVHDAGIPKNGFKTTIVDSGDVTEMGRMNDHSSMSSAMNEHSSLQGTMGIKECADIMGDHFALGCGTPTNSPIVPPSKFNVIPAGLDDLEALIRAELGIMAKRDGSSMIIPECASMIIPECANMATPGLSHVTTPECTHMTTNILKGRDAPGGMLNQTFLQDMYNGPEMLIEKWRTLDTISLNSTTCSPTVHSTDAPFGESKMDAQNDDHNDHCGRNSHHYGIAMNEWTEEDDGWFDTVIKAGLKLLGDDSVFGPGNVFSRENSNFNDGHNGSLWSDHNGDHYGDRREPWMME